MDDTQILQQILSEIQGMKSDISRNGVLLEALDSKVQLIYENQVTIIEHDKRQDSFESTLDEHDTRLFAVEQVIKVG